MTDEKNVLDVEVETAETTAETIVNPEEVMATIVKRDDGYHVVDHDGTEGPVCKLTNDLKSICLTPNAANRQWYAVKRLEAAFADPSCESVPLYYKGTRTLGSTGPKTKTVPHAKLIAYLSEEEQAEYNAIIDRARAAMEADKKKPMTDIEKAELRLKKAQEALAKLQAAQNA